MKLLGLDLMAYGPFTEVTLDFGSADTNFHVVHGDNEAGKSSTLRALNALLYGIHERTDDDFVHANSDLRIGGHLVHSDGRELRVVRRKGRKNTLADSEGRALDQSALDALLGGVDSGRFATVFGVDHQALSRGSREILEGGGEVGQSLFAAGLGTVNLRAILDSLDDEAQALFKPRGSKQAINKALGEFKEASKTARELSLSSRQWIQSNNLLRALRDQGAGLAAKLKDLGTERSRLERLRATLPRLGQRRELVARVESLATVVVLGPEFAQRHREAAQSLEMARAAEARAEDRRVRLHADLDALAVPEELLSEEVAVTALHKRLGGHQKALADTTLLAGKRGQLRADAHALLEELGFEVSLDAVESVRPGLALKARVRDLAQRHQALVDAGERAKREVAKNNLLLAEARAALRELPAPRDARALRAVVERQRRRDDPEAARSKATREHDATHQRALVALNALGLFEGSLEAAEKLPVPVAESVERYRDDFQNVEGRRTRLDTDAGKLRAEVEGLTEQLEVLRREGDVPTEGDLTNAREHRRSGWHLVRRAWLEQQDVAEAARALDPTRELPAAFEHSVEQADEVADRLRREADRVAKKAELEARKDRLHEELQRVHFQGTTLAEEEALLRASWTTVWSPLGIAPLPPREMGAWLARHGELATQARTERELAELVQALGADIVTYRDELARELGRLDEAAPGEGETLAALLDRAQRVVEAIEAKERSRDELTARVAGLESDLEDARTEEREKRGCLEAWRSEWEGAVAGLGLAADASPAEANAVLDKLGDLFAKVDEAKKHERRIGAIRHDAEEFDQEVAALVERVAAELADRPSDQAAEELQRRLALAKAGAATSVKLEEQLGTLDAELAEAKVTITLATERLDELCTQAGCERHEELEAAEQRSSERVELQRQLEVLDTQLTELGGGATVTELIVQAEDVDPDALPARIAELEHERAELEKQRTDLDQQIGGQRTDLDRLDGSAEAAEAAERGEGLLAEARAHVERYVRLRLASELLRREIERYREENQGPVLARAEELFATLTLDSFTGLRTDFDADDEPVIVAVRASKETVGVAGMSDGTRDQLYLAIRLATLERYFDVHEPFPLVVDDILIGFDDRRSLAALEVLAELSRKTQVIFFTHHDRLVELARSLGDGIAQIHDLTR